MAWFLETVRADFEQDVAVVEQFKNRQIQFLNQSIRSRTLVRIVSRTHHHCCAAFHLGASKVSLKAGKGYKEGSSRFTPEHLGGNDFHTVLGSSANSCLHQK